MFNVGDKVMTNGYPGTIAVVHTGQLASMVDVRLESGGVCVDVGDVFPGDVYDAMVKMAQSDMRKARKEGVIMIAQTKRGTVELSYQADSKCYAVHGAAGEVFSAPARLAAQLIVAELYVIVSK